MFAIVLFLFCCWIAGMLIYVLTWLLGWISYKMGFAWESGRQSRRVKQARADWQPTLPTRREEQAIHFQEPVDYGGAVERDSAGNVAYDPQLDLSRDIDKLDDPDFMRQLRLQNYYPNPERKGF